MVSEPPQAEGEVFGDTTQVQGEVVDEYPHAEWKVGLNSRSQICVLIKTLNKPLPHFAWRFS